MSILSIHNIVTKKFLQLHTENFDNYYSLMSHGMNRLDRILHLGGILLLGQQTIKVFMD
jgi:hypothetical protein